MSSFRYSIPSQRIAPSKSRLSRHSQRSKSIRSSTLSLATDKSETFSAYGIDNNYLM